MLRSQATTRLIIAGASGLVGRRLSAVAAAAALPVLGTSSRTVPGMLPLDLRRAENFDYSRLGPGDVIALTAGISAPDACAREPERVRRVNVEGTARFISGALAQGARVIFFSSDTVYGEREGPFDEAATCAPHGVYAQMKHEVERRFDAHPGVKALRLSYVFCSEDGFTRYLRDCAASARAAEVFHPFYRAVVHREDVVQAVIALAAHWESFPAFAVNCGGPHVLSRIDFVQAMKDAVLPTLESRIVDPGDAFFTHRPRRIGMRSPRLAELLGRPPRALGDAISAEFGATAGPA